MITPERLNEVTHEQYPFLSYDENEAKKYISYGGFPGTDDDTAAWLFADYLVSQGLCAVEE